MFSYHLGESPLVLSLDFSVPKSYSHLLTLLPCLETKPMSSLTLLPSSISWPCRPYLLCGSDFDSLRPWSMQFRAVREKKKNLRVGQMAASLEHGLQAQMAVEWSVVVSPYPPSTHFRSSGKPAACSLACLLPSSCHDSATDSSFYFQEK
jgi:hypothetical protein